MNSRLEHPNSIHRAVHNMNFQPLGMILGRAVCVHHGGLRLLLTVASGDHRVKCFREQNRRLRACPCPSPPLTNCSRSPSGPRKVSRQLSCAVLGRQ
jgi:hypothetical protein